MGEKIVCLPCVNIYLPDDLRQLRMFEGYKMHFFVLNIN